MAEIIDDDNLGFIKLHRKILTWEWYRNPNVFCLFIHCLILANYKQKKWEGHTVKTGEFITSISGLAEGCGLSVRQVRTALDKLESTNEVTRTTTNNFTVIKVNNYSAYHDCEKTTDKQNDKQDDKQMTNRWQTDDKQMATTKKEDILSISSIKKEKNDKKKEKKINKEKEKELIFPDCVDRALIEKYIQNRIDIKKKMTHHAKELFLLKIQKFHDKGEDVKDLIEKAIIAGWSDIYEQKGKDNAKGKNFRGSERKPLEKAESKSGRTDLGPTTYTFAD